MALGLASQRSQTQSASTHCRSKPDRTPTLPRAAAAQRGRRQCRREAGRPPVAAATRGSDSGAHLAALDHLDGVDGPQPHGEDLGHVRNSVQTLGHAAKEHVPAVEMRHGRVGHKDHGVVRVLAVVAHAQRARHRVAAHHGLVRERPVLPHERLAARAVAADVVAELDAHVAAHTVHLAAEEPLALGRLAQLQEVLHGDGEEVVRKLVLDTPLLLAVPGREDHECARTLAPVERLRGEGRQDLCLGHLLLALQSSEVPVVVLGAARARHAGGRRRHGGAN
mmetsp:Transcript_13187/g.50489  ORF Transcript_13187/g.50489 Transcript_13187/m.50489 type:complete len:280 (-) Transcript_13187:80-919(-)